MEKIKGYNRNVYGGKRPHKKIQRYGKAKNLAERILLDTKGHCDYQYRVGQITKVEYEKFLKFFEVRIKEKMNTNFK